MNASPERKIEHFNLSDSVDPQALLGTLSKHYSIAEIPSFNTTQHFYDTFDWRLYRQGFVFIRDTDSYRLSTIQNDALIATFSQNLKAGLRFWWDLPECALRNQLRSILEVRALLCSATIKKRVQTLRILNGDRKTTTRVQFQDVEISDERKKASFKILGLEKIRGYEIATQDVHRFLRAQGLECTSEDLVSIGFRALGKKLGDYSSKINVSLLPEMSASLAVKRILNSQLRVMQQNEDGIISDIDIEFLHDFRVASRRIRSVLTQIKEVLPKDINDQFKNEFARLGRQTGRLRDLDVYLSKDEEYKEMLPVNLQPGLAIFFKELLKERKLEHGEIVKVLSDSSYRTTMSSCQEMVKSEDEENLLGKNSSKSVINVSTQFIWKKFNHVLKKGNKIHDESPDSELHTLRIECKKLRYLLEFFSPVFPQKEFELLVRKLKKLQENLGEFNDLCIQNEDLTKFLSTFRSTNEEDRIVSAAIGGLITTLFRKKKAVRLAFSQAFEEFTKRKM